MSTEIERIDAAHWQWCAVCAGLWREHGIMTSQPASGWCAHQECLVFPDPAAVRTAMALGGSEAVAVIEHALQVELVRRYDELHPVRDRRRSYRQWVAATFLLVPEGEFLTATTNARQRGIMWGLFPSWRPLELHDLGGHAEQGDE